MNLINIERIYKEAINRVSSSQSWPGHFLVKRIDTEIILKHIDIDEDNENKCLEIGCGNAFQSVLLAGLFDKLIATDSFDNNFYHKTEMRDTKRLIESLNVKNVKLVNCSATALPFPDCYFDFVFSSSVLEHIREKDLALKEIRRVLKPGCHLLTIVPTHMPSIYAFPHMFLYILARIGKLFFLKNNRAFQDKKQDKNEGERLSLFKRFRKNHPSFPLPEPHGSYRNIFDELSSQLPCNWLKLFKKNGFVVKDSFGLCLMPWLLIEPFSTNIAARIYLLTKTTNIRLSSLKALKYISYLMGIVAVKDNYN